MSEQREMSLDEWVGLLSEVHLANKQYQQLQQQVQELEQLCSKLSESGYNASKVLALLPQLLYSIEIRDWYSVPMILSKARE